MAITHRSVILEYFAYVGLVLTTIVHRLVWPWYRCRDKMLTPRRLARPHGGLECATGVSRSLVENHITAWCRRGPCWCAPAHVERSSVSIHVTGHEYTARMTEDRSLECWRSSMMAYIDIQRCHCGLSSWYIMARPETVSKTKQTGPADLLHAGYKCRRIKLLNSYMMRDQEERKDT